jgi:hypothetical protein
LTQEDRYLKNHNKTFCKLKIKDNLLQKELQLEKKVYGREAL